ncbi:hypothetical protein PBAL39_15384 [Pedobacter sp. BAL39]|nr:hypothetical protein PBAL39_15384 [Pedobacter sp. BAL39]
MVIMNKKTKIAIWLVTILEAIFLIRAWAIYSFYNNDELYGDGVHDTNRYDKEFTSTILLSLLITILLCLASVLVFRQKKAT